MFDFNTVPRRAQGTFDVPIKPQQLPMDSVFGWWMRIGYTTMKWLEPMQATEVSRKRNERRRNEQKKAQKARMKAEAAVD